MNSTAKSLLKPALRRFVSPPIFDFWASSLSPTLAWDRVLARVVERRVEARDSVTLVLRANRNFHGFVPGQHLNVTADLAGVRISRSYSFTNLPNRQREIAITVKQVEGGKLSGHLCTRTQVGDTLELGAAFGNMTIAPDNTRPLLLLAAGSGITPLMSLLRAQAAAGMPQPVTLIYWAKRREEFCFAEELRALAASHAGFTLRLVLTQSSELQEGESAGRPSTELLAELVADLQSRAAYACGPAGFVQTLSKLIGGQALSFASEAFTPPTVDAGTATGTVRVTLAASRKVLEIAAGQPLLAALEAQGIKPASGCRMGICNSCACGKLAGRSQNLLDGRQSFEPDSALRICINAASSDLTLDL